MRFIVSDELGRLARWLRILGFDAIVEKDRAHIVIESLKDNRVILTRDSKMSRFTGTRMVKVENDFVEEQLKQVIGELNLRIDRNGLFKICVLCNAKLALAEKEDVKGKVPQYVFDTQEFFLKCPECDRVYWQGTHWALVNKFLDRIGKE